MKTKIVKSFYYDYGWIREISVWKTKRYWAIKIIGQEVTERVMPPLTQKMYIPLHLCANEKEAAHYSTYLPTAKKVSYPRIYSWASGFNGTNL